MQQVQEIISQVRKVVVGKDPVIASILMAMLAQGHVLLEDVPGVGKTTLALAFSRTMDLCYKRMQFTPDVMPSDITGYTTIQLGESGGNYVPGAAMCNLFLADEINRASSKTQSALLEVMEENSITVDGVTRAVPQPFLVIATQNPAGSSGTQPLPESQLDRFMVRLSMGYPDRRSEVEMLRRHQNAVSLDSVNRVITPQDLTLMQREVESIYASDALFAYITELAGWTRAQPAIRIGVSPRGTIALLRMSKAAAYLSGRDYLIPQDVQLVFESVSAHRILLSPRALVSGVTEQQLAKRALTQVQAPVAV
ncbi:MAG: MoxR family ATPase [Eubacteriales bacterium]